MTASVCNVDSNLAGIELRGPVSAEHAAILTKRLRFIAGLVPFCARRDELLAARRQRQVRLDGGEMPDFLPQTEAIRRSTWRVAPLPADLQDRRVEITGPVDRKMVINALNSGASCFMADFEDSHSPTWTGTLDGQINFRDAVSGRSTTCIQRRRNTTN